MPDYIVRASIDGVGIHFNDLPKTFGPFTLDNSKNAELVFIEENWDPDLPLPNPIPTQDHNYPMNMYCIDAVINTPSTSEAFRTGHTMIENLEVLFRLFQKGYIYIRRHKIFQQDRPNPFFLSFDAPLPVNPKSFAWSEYYFSDQELASFVNFFNENWDILPNDGPLFNALLRFSSAYEKTTWGDRLVDLMIALESLFSEPQETTYKISLRYACFLYGPGPERTAAFGRMKRIYAQRSAVVHSGLTDDELRRGSRSRKGLTFDDVSWLEEEVRRTIKKLLQLLRSDTARWTRFLANEHSAMDEELFLNPRPLPAEL